MNGTFEQSTKAREPTLTSITILSDREASLARESCSQRKEDSHESA